jgi:uncharacterized protein
MNDFAGVVSASYEEQVETIATELKQKTDAELAVVTVSELGSESLEMVAVRLFEAWGIGEKGRDNGVLLILAMQEKRVRIEVGYGMESLITDGLSGEILDYYVLPLFRENEYGKGLFQGAAMIAGVIARDAGVEITGSLDMRRERAESEEGGAGGIFFIIFIVFLVIVTKGRIIPWILLGMLSGGGGGRGGGFGSGGFGGGFGGFGGGMSGGGGASRSF